MIVSGKENGLVYELKKGGAPVKCEEGCGLQIYSGDWRFLVRFHFSNKTYNSYWHEQCFFKDVIKKMKKAGRPVNSRFISGFKFGLGLDKDS